MRGSEIAAALPEKPSPIRPDLACFETREEMILDQVKSGNAVVNWQPVSVDFGPYRATFLVTNEALRIGEPGDSFRPAVSACTQQRIADLFDATLLTPKLLDAIWDQADIRIDPPVTLGSKVPMRTTSRMLTHHNAVEKRIAKQVDELFGGEVDSSDLLVANVGKHWVNDRRLLQRNLVHGHPQAINYGWWISNKYAKGSPAARQLPVTKQPGINIWQTPGGAHPIYHQDYSQVVRLVARQVTVCGPTGLAGLSLGRVGFGQEDDDLCEAGQACTLADGSQGVSKCVDIYDLALDEELNPLVSHNGIVYMRQEAVPWEPGPGQSIWGGLRKPPPPNTAAPGGVLPPPPVLVAGMSPGAMIVTGLVGIGLGWAAYELLRGKT